MKNTRIHLPRPNYEEKIKNLTSLDYTKSSYYDKKYIMYNNLSKTKLINEIFFKKYIIYKKKYLHLKYN
jgi:hypothetical protein